MQSVKQYAPLFFTVAAGAATCATAYALHAGYSLSSMTSNAFVTSSIESIAANAFVMSSIETGSSLLASAKALVVADPRIVLICALVIGILAVCKVVKACRARSAKKAQQAATVARGPQTLPQHYENLKTTCREYFFVAVPNPGDSNLPEKLASCWQQITNLKAMLQTNSLEGEVVLKAMRTINAFEHIIYRTTIPPNERADKPLQVSYPELGSPKHVVISDFKF